VGDQRMVGNVNFHNPYLTALSFHPNEWEYEQRDTGSDGRATHQ
jgi:hypothetical protein